MASILVIDDEASVRRLLRLLLERAGHRVVEARDGAEGVLLFRSAPTDLVITDLYMPGQDGIETIQQLREEYPDCRILAVSGGASLGADGPLEDAKLLGASDVLAKPFQAEDLLEAVRRLIA